MRARSRGCRSASRTCSAPRASRTTAGSRILEGFVPPYESTVTARLWDAGAVLIGKTNLDEFAMGSSTVTSYFEPTINPWTPAGSDAPLVPGGSSGGSTAAVAARLCPAAIGTDTGGSIRQPAAFCGVVGMKPTYGRCSRFGIVAFASSLDQAGPIARTVEDCALLLQQMAGYDPQGQHQRRPAARRPCGGADRRRPRPAGRHPEGVPARRHAARDRRALAAGHRLAAGRRLHGRRGQPAAHQICTARLLHRGTGRGVLEPRALRRHALRPAGRGQGPDSTPTPGRARRASARRCAGA